MVLRAQTGDHAAFTALAAAAISRLHRTARLILRDDDRASDAVQDALVRAWLGIRAVRDPDRFEAWLNRLLVRSCYREVDRDRRRRVFEVHLTDLDLQAVPAAASEVADRDYLESGFRRLTADHRAVLVLHHYLALPDREAAETLGIPAGTFKSRLNRATTALRAALDAEGRTVAAQESLA